MKKIFAIAAFAMMSLAASAQVELGGGIGFNSVKATKDAKAATAFSFTPEVGYHINEKWMVGAELAFNSVKAGEGESANSFGIGAFGRYHFCEAGNLKLFVELGADYTTYNHDAGNSFGVAFRPGFTYELSEKWGLTAKTGVLGYEKNSDKRGGGSVFSAGIDNADLSFSLFYNF